MRLSYGTPEVMDKLNSVDWTAHGFDSDYEVMGLVEDVGYMRLTLQQKSSGDIIADCIDYKLGNAESVELEFDDSGSFDSVLEAAGLSDA